MQSSQSACQARFDRAQRDAKNFGNFIVRTILQIEKRDRRLVNLIEPRERVEHLGGVRAVRAARRNGRQFRSRLLKFQMWKAGLPSPGTEKFAVQCGEQPGFHSGYIAQLVTFNRPNAKRLLRQIAGVRFIARQTEGKLIQRHVVARHQGFKINTFRHIAASQLRATRRRIVPAKILGNISFPRLSHPHGCASSTWKMAEPLKKDDQERIKI